MTLRVTLTCVFVTSIACGGVGSAPASVTLPAPAAPVAAAPAPVAGEAPASKPVKSAAKGVVGALRQVPAGGAGCGCSAPGSTDLAFWRDAAASKAVMNLDGADRTLFVRERPEGESTGLDLTGEGYVAHLRLVWMEAGAEGAAYDGYLSFRPSVGREVLLSCSCGA